MNEKTKVNDGGGLYDNLGLIDTIIIDAKQLLKELASGDYVAFEVTHIGMIQKLSNLKKGVKDDTESLKKQIDELRKVIRDIDPAQDDGQKETGECDNVQR